MSMSGRTRRRLERKRSISRPWATGSAWAIPSRWLTREPAAGAAGGHPDAHLAYVVNNLGDRQKIRGETMVGDDVELLVHPLPVGAVARVPAQHHARRGPGGEDPLGAAVGGADEAGLGEVHGTDAEVVLGVHGAGLGGTPGLREQAPGVGGTQSGRLRDAVGSLGHGGGVLEPALAAVERVRRVARVDGDQAAGRVEDVGDRALAGIGIADGIGQHGRDALLGGEADGTGGQPERTGPGTGAAVVDGLQAQGVAVDLPPRSEQPGGAVGAARGERPPHLGAGPEQDEDALAAQGSPGDERDLGGPRVRGGDHPAQLGPPGGPVPGQEDGPRGGLVHECPALDGGAPPVRGLAGPGRAPRPGRSRRGRPGGSPGGRYRHVHPEQRPDARLRTRLREPHRARHRVAVGEREGVHAPLGGTLRQPLRVRASVAHGEPRNGVQMRKTRHPRPPASLE